MRCSQVLMAFAPLTLCVVMGCSTTSPVNQGTNWPTVNALPEKQPEDLKKAVAGSMLRRGDDGFLYVVGGMGDQVQAGTNFLVRHAGDWPIKDFARPALAAGQIVHRYGKDVALAHISYAMPNVKLDDLIVTWEDAPKIGVGKGLGRVTRLLPDEAGDVEISIGALLDVQVGDIYGVMKPSAVDKAVNGVQFGRRLSGLCIVSKVSQDRAKCRISQGSTRHPNMAKITAQDEVVFFEHTYGKPPRQAALQFSNIKGDKSGALRKRLVDQMNAYIGTHAQPNAKAEALNLDVDATHVEFQYIKPQVALKKGPQLLIGGTLKNIGGTQHLFINYTDINQRIRIDTVAHTPVGGIDLGPLKDINTTKLNQAFGLIWSAVLVHRDQQGESLAHLRQLLSDKELQGSMRWHARDQYALRWAALGRVDEALWLVLEDELVARAAKDSIAELNAMRTRAQIYELLNANTRATALAKAYLEHKKEDSNRYAVVDARTMYAQMLLAEGKLALAQEQLEAIEKLCSDGCRGELFASVGTFLMSTPESAHEMRSDLLTRLGKYSHSVSMYSKSLLWLCRGLELLRTQKYAQSLIALREAERMFKEVNSVIGVAHTKHFLFLSYLIQGKPAEGIQEAIKVLELANELNDHTISVNMHYGLGMLFKTLDQARASAEHMQLIGRMLSALLTSQLAIGDLSEASETIYAYGDIMLKNNYVEKSMEAFNSSVNHAMRGANFKVAALSSLRIALIARQRDEPELYKKTIAQAQLMAKISKDPTIQATIERTITQLKDSTDLKSKPL